MNALIIGGSGFVGGHLINHLQNDCKWFIGVTKLANEKVDKENIKIYDLDILNKEDVKTVIQDFKPDCIFHLAAQSSVGLSWKNPKLTVDININGTLNVLDAIRESDISPRVLLIGSGEEYGHLKPEEIPVKEETIQRPGNVYAATKACQNMLGKLYSDAYDMDIMQTRSFNHFGPNQAPIFVVADFCEQVAKIEKGQQNPILKVGNLKAKRDFTDVRDVVKAYSLLIKKGKKGETYNVGSGNALEVQEILEMIVSLSTANIEIVIDQSKFRPVDIPIIEADVSKLVEATEWTRQISLKTSIEDTLNAWREV